MDQGSFEEFFVTVLIIRTVHFFFVRLIMHFIYDSKRTQVYLSTAKDPKQDISLQVKTEILQFDDSYYANNVGQDIKRSSRTIQFETFSQANAVGAPERKGTIHFKDMEDLASTYRPSIKMKP